MPSGAIRTVAQLVRFGPNLPRGAPGTATSINPEVLGFNSFYLFFFFFTVVVAQFEIRWYALDNLKGSVDVWDVRRVGGCAWGR